MLDHPTHNQLRELKLDGMADAFAELQSQDGVTDLSHAEWLGLLIDREVANRTTKRFQTRMRTAKLRHVGAAIEDVDYRTPRKLDKALFQQLATGRWIDERRNLMITGPCGVGKTWLAVRQCLSDHWRSIGSPSAKGPAEITPRSSTNACRASLLN